MSSEGMTKFEDGLNKQNDKVMITGDDILIEYVERLHNALKQINEANLKVSWKSCIDKFVGHYVWHNNEQKDAVNI